MVKKLAPPPDVNARKEDTDIKLRIDEQRKAARQKAESRQAKRVMEKKQDFLDTLSQAISEMASMTQELSTSITQQESAFTEIASGAAQVSQSTEESAASVSQVRSSVKSIGDSIQIIVEKSSNLQNLLRSTSGVIGSLVSGVNNTVRMNRETEELLNNLEVQTKGIEDSVTGVADSAKKINLHALNAAIEASRAEEHGAGFSIVADEIRKLAEESNRNTEQIVAATQDVRSNVNNVKGDLAALLAKAQDDAENANKISANINTSAEDMIVIRQSGDRINALALAHSSEVDKIMESSDIIASAAIQTANATQSASSAISQQVKGIHSINTNTLDIESQVENIKDEGFSEKAAEEMATSAEELSAIVEECSSAVAQISSAIAEISQSAGEQSATCKNNSRLISVAELAAKEINEIAKANIEKIENQRDLLKAIDTDSATMITAISKISDDYKTSAMRIVSLEASMESLEVFASQLEYINVVTNLLAVNGRIESAKAGEQGAGFAKVSEDIRALVATSSEQIRLINMRIRSMQKNISRVAEDISQAASQIFQQVEKAVETTANLKTVEGDIVELVERITDIQAASVSSLAAIENIKVTIEQISKAADQAATATEQASAAADQQAKGLQQLASMAEEITGQADKL
jgi:methyl-accepting chemotaxis protein